MVDDTQLIRQIKAGKTEALDELIQKYYSDIYTYCYRRIGSEADAQDITQEVFLHFCRNFDSYTHRGKCKNYLYVIARNLCINTIQKKTPVSLEEVWDEMLPGTDVVESKIEMANSVEPALNALPDGQKEVILLRFYHDLKLKDIADIMGENLSTTKYRLNQGLKRLGELLNREDWL